MPNTLLYKEVKDIMDKAITCMRCLRHIAKLDPVQQEIWRITGQCEECFETDK